MATNIRSILNEELRKDVKTELKHLTYLYLLDYIKANSKPLEMIIETNIRMEYVGDFYGLLVYLNSNTKLQYLNMLLNDLNSSNEYDGSSTSVLIIDETDAKISSIMERLKLS